MDIYGNGNLDTKTKPFQNGGECSDEIVFNFTDGEKLYVSQNFLCYASPVFKTMFQEVFGETHAKEKVLAVESTDFLELLLTLHPGVQKTISNGNVLRISSLAENYKIGPTINKCKNVMKKWLSEEIDTAVKEVSNADRIKHARTCLTILIKAISLGYEDIVKQAIEVVARFGHELFTGSLNVLKEEHRPLFDLGKSGRNKKLSSSKVKDEKVGTMTKQINDPFTSIRKDLKPECHSDECKKLFESLSDEMKNRLLLERLELCDVNTMR